MKKIIFFRSAPVFFSFLLLCAASQAASPFPSAEKKPMSFSAQASQNRESSAEKIIANKNQTLAFSQQPQEYETAQLESQDFASASMGTGQITHRADNTVTKIFYPNAGAADIKLVEFTYFADGSIQSVIETNNTFRSERRIDTQYVIDTRGNRVLASVLTTGRFGARGISYTYQYESATKRNFTGRLFDGGGEVSRGYEIIDSQRRVIERVSNERFDATIAYDPMNRVIVTTSYTDTGYTEKVYTSRVVNGTRISASDVTQRGLPPGQRRTYVKSGNTPLLRETVTYTFDASGARITGQTSDVPFYRMAALNRSGADFNEYVSNRILSYTAAGQVRRTEASLNDKRETHDYAYNSTGRLTSDTKTITLTSGGSTETDLYGFDSQGKLVIVKKTIDSFPFGGIRVYNYTYTYSGATRRNFEAGLEGTQQVLFGYDLFDSQGRITEHVENLRDGAATPDPLLETVSRFTYSADRQFEQIYSRRIVNGAQRTARQVLSAGLPPAQRIERILRGDVRLEKDRRTYQFASNGSTVMFTTIEIFNTVSS